MPLSHAGAYTVDTANIEGCGKILPEFSTFQVKFNSNRWKIEYKIYSHVSA